MDYHFGSTTGVGYTNDISEGGIFLSCSPTAKPGTRIYLRLHLPGSQSGEPLKIIGVVTREVERVGTADRDAVTGMGIHFEVAYARTRDALGTFIDNLLAIEGGNKPRAQRADIHEVEGSTAEHPEYAVRFPSVRAPTPSDTSMNAAEVQQAFAFKTPDAGVDWGRVGGFIVKLLILAVVVALAYWFVTSIGSLFG